MDQEPLVISVERTRPSYKHKFIVARNWAIVATTLLVFSVGVIIYQGAK